MVLIGLTLVYFVETDKIIDNLCIYFTGKSLQVGINNRVVQIWIFVRMIAQYL